MNAIRYYATVTITRLFFLAALAFSFGEIRHGFLQLGTAPSKAWFAPICIDLFAVLGAIARSAAFTDRTRRIGFRVQVTASTISLIANVGFGETLGDRIFGAMIVIGYVFAEWFADNMEKRTEEQDVEVQPVAPVEVVVAPAPKPAAKGGKGQPWSPERRARHEAQKAAKQAVADEIAALEDALKLASAPVSPAPYEPQYL